MFTTEQRMFAVLHHRHISRVTERPLQSSAWVNHRLVVGRKNLENVQSQGDLLVSVHLQDRSIQSLVEIIVKTDPFVTIHKLKWILQIPSHIRTLSTVYRCLKTLKMSYKVAARSPQHQAVDPTTPIPCIHHTSLR
jgi:hypothetical protein